MKKILLISFGLILLIGIWLIVFPIGYLSSQRPFEDVSIQGEGYQLHGYISEGTDSSNNWVILVHGNRKPGQDHELYKIMRENLPLDYSVFAVDLRGFGGSVGDGENQLPATIDRSDDLAITAAYLVENYGVQEDQIALIGHSYGAAQILNMAQDQSYSLVIPIGLGDWDALLKSESGIEGYQQKFQANTGILVDMQVLRGDAEKFSSEALFNDCPESPVWFVYASQDDAIPVHKEAYLTLAEECPDLVQWGEVSLSDHMYGTEMVKLPEPLRGIYARLSLSILKYRLGQILHSAAR